MTKLLLVTATRTHRRAGINFPAGSAVEVRLDGDEQTNRRLVEALTDDRELIVAEPDIDANEPDEPSATGEQDQPSATGEQDQPPATGEQDKPPATGEQNKPPATARKKTATGAPKKTNTK